MIGGWLSISVQDCFKSDPGGRRKAQVKIEKDEWNGEERDTPIGKINLFQLSTWFQHAPSSCTMSMGLGLDSIYPHFLPLFQKPFLFLFSFLFFGGGGDWGRGNSRTGEWGKSEREDSLIGTPHK